jgi:hypothetical protein
MNLVSADRPKKALYAVSKWATLNYMVSVQKSTRVPKVMEREI